MSKKDQVGEQAGAAADGQTAGAKKERKARVAKWTWHIGVGMGTGSEHPGEIIAGPFATQKAATKAFAAQADGVYALMKVRTITKATRTVERVTLG